MTDVRTEMLEPFGPNVVSTDGDLWRFHIRITLPPLGEAVNKLVWSETTRQADFLAEAWASLGSSNLKNDVYSLTTKRHVLCWIWSPSELDRER